MGAAARDVTAVELFGFNAMVMAAEVDARFDSRRALAEHAAHLNRMHRPKLFARPGYELLSGALVWPDEFRRDTPTHVCRGLRPVWAYRTSLMLDAPRADLAEWWEFGLAHFPRWVGFRPERRRATPKLLELYRRERVGVQKCLRDLERNEGSTAPLT